MKLITNKEGEYMKIGNVELNGQVILAPMAGVCNSAMRKICKEMGCALVCAEMVSDKGMIYNSKKTKDMLYFEESERPISQQIFGSDKETFVSAAKLVYEIMHSTRCVIRHRDKSMTPRLFFPKTVIL